MDCRDESLSTALHQACRLALVRHVEHLLIYPADINAINFAGNAPLHIYNGKVERALRRFRRDVSAFFSFMSLTQYLWINPIKLRMNRDWPLRIVPLLWSFNLIDRMISFPFAKCTWWIRNVAPSMSNRRNEVDVPSPISFTSLQSIPKFAEVECKSLFLVMLPSERSRSFSSCSSVQPFVIAGISQCP